jgi:hypothetical protein
VNTYKLSWEEFLESHQESLPVPSIASFVATISIAVAVGLFGIVLTYAVDPGSKMMGSSFCWLSLVLFLAAFWDLRVRAARRRTRGIRELRAVYAQYYSGDRIFAFDREKWTLETQAGKQEGLWTGLLNAVERKSVITLSARDQLTAVVPKRILSTDELKSLRGIAIRPVETTWHSRVSLLDYLLTEVPSLWRRHPFLMADAHICGLFFFGTIANDMYHMAGLETNVGWLLAGLFLFLTITTQFWYFLIKYQTSHNELRMSWQVGLSERGVHIKTSRIDFFSAWTNFRKARETMRCFLLYHNSPGYYTFPKSCLPAEQQTAVRKLLHAKLATNSGCN